MVAVGIMMVLLVIILVPVNMALNVFHIGKARNEANLAARQVMADVVSDLRRAIYVFPNENMPGITTKAPYTSITPLVADDNDPYYQNGTGPAPNTSRIDMILPQLDSNGSVGIPVKASNYIVTYYARRFNLDDTIAYDANTNPLALYRAQYAYRTDAGTAFSSYDKTNTDNTSGRYPVAIADNGQVWLWQNEHGEPNLATPGFGICNYSASTTASSHTRVTPRDMGMTITNENLSAATPIYQPDSTFTCDDTNDDGKIDRVTINLSVTKYDDIGAASRNGSANGQTVRLTDSVNLTNVK